MNFIDRPSPNFDTREGHAIDMLVLHYTGMKTGAEAIERLCNRDSRVSAHYVVDEDGSVLRLVGEDRRAWHAGISSWRGHSNINQRSIGIEIVNQGHEFGYHPFPAAQMKMAAMLCRDILARNRGIEPRNVVGHSDIAPTRKEDPGELFDWKTLAGLGIGLWPINPAEKLSSRMKGLAADLPLVLMGASPLSTQNIDPIATDPLPPCSEIQTQLAEYGYDCPISGVFDDTTRKVITAFQRHFCAKRITGVWDRECALQLAWLLAMV